MKKVQGIFEDFIYFEGDELMRLNEAEYEELKERVKTLEYRVSELYRNYVDIRLKELSEEFGINLDIRDCYSGYWETDFCLIDVDRSEKIVPLRDLTEDNYDYYERWRALYKSEVITAIKSYKYDLINSKEVVHETSESKSGKTKKEV